MLSFCQGISSFAGMSRRARAVSQRTERLDRCRLTVVAYGSYRHLDGVGHSDGSWLHLGKLSIPGALRPCG